MPKLKKLIRKTKACMSREQIMLFGEIKAEKRPSKAEITEMLYLGDTTFNFSWTTVKEMFHEVVEMISE